MSAPVIKFNASPDEIAQAQLTFDWLIPYGPMKQTLTTEEVGRILGMGQDSVRGLIDTAQLESHQFNASGSSDRQTNRVTRRSVTVFLMRSATYEADAIVGSLTEIFKTQLTEAQRRSFLAGIQPQARR